MTCEHNRAFPIIIHVDGSRGRTNRKAIVKQYIWLDSIMLYAVCVWVSFWCTENIYIYKSTSSTMVLCLLGNDGTSKTDDFPE